MKKLLFGWTMIFGMWLIAYSIKESSPAGCREKWVNETAGDNAEILNSRYNFILLPTFKNFSE